MSVAEVKLWGRTIGAVAWDNNKNIANFEYDESFLNSSIEVSPVMMPLSRQVYSFPALSRNTFYGLPGMLADSLPDKFGNALINAWLVKEGRSPWNFNSVERLCYIGKRGMGALEFIPSQGPSLESSQNINVEALVNLASEILTKREIFKGSFSGSDREKVLQDILRVGSSPGGARAKAVIAWNSETNEVRSGQVEVGEGFSYWLLKFDGVSGNKDKDLEDPKGFGLIEYVYYQMALDAGIEMSECRLLQENGRNHFMTKRFDRTDAGKKIHMQSLGALAHYDFNQTGVYCYEQAVGIMRKLGLPMASMEEQFRRMVFNIIARNQDDHVKNIAFLMDRFGTWKLSPAFDMIYSYNPSGDWTSTHQMSMNGKRDKFDKEDFITFANSVSIRQGRAREIIKQVQDAVLKWPRYAQQAGIPQNIFRKIANAHRTDIFSYDSAKIYMKE